MPIEIRTLRAKDSESVAILTAQLGYPSSPEECFARISLLQDRSDHTLLGAFENSQLIGFLHATLHDQLIVDRQAEVAALVVLETFRGRGVGNQLMKAGEEWAKGRAEKIVLRSRTTRTEAHKFYQGLGYTIDKTSYTLSKAIK